MKNFILVFFLTLVGIIHANPIVPSVFSEIYFDGEDWILELYDYENFGLLNLDNAYLVTNEDTSYFNNNITFNENEVFVVTNNDLQDSLFIDRTGDEVYFFKEEEFFDELHFGNNWINAPYEGQSIGVVSISSISSSSFYPVKENNPTIGYDPFSVNTRGTINGFVFDIYGDPVENAELHCIPGYYFELITDENGFFENDMIYGKNYQLKVWIDNIQYGTQAITVEPDSITTVNFYTNYSPQIANEDKLSSPKEILSNYPNPFNPETTISFELTEKDTKTAKIEIFNSKGQKIETFTFNGALLQAENSFTWNAKGQSSGVYFYCLKIDGKVIENRKMLFLK